MAAPVVTTHLIEDGYHVARYLFTGSISDTQESSVTKIDVSELAYAYGDPQTVAIESIKWNISGSGVITVILGSTTVALLSGHGHMRGGSLSVEGGDVKFTTASFSNAAYQVEVAIRKADGFSLEPAATEADVDNTAYVTDETITATVDFNMPVLVTGAPVLELNIGEATVEMQCVTPNNSEATSLVFEYVVQEADQAEAENVSFGDIVLRGSAKLTGGFGNAPAQLLDFTYDLSAVTVNAEGE